MKIMKDIKLIIKKLCIFSCSIPVYPKNKSKIQFKICSFSFVNKT